VKNTISESEIIAFFRERITEINTATKQDYCTIRLVVNSSPSVSEGAVEWQAYTPNGSWNKATATSADTVALQIGGSSAESVAARKRKEAQELLAEAERIEKGANQ